MAKKQFKAQSKRLLDMMIHSIYTNKDIFLRELISNGSDAIDKLYYGLLSEGGTGLSRSDFTISIEPDSENHILKITDMGIGMDKEELEENLGTIAKSGSLAFKEALRKEENGEKLDQTSIIGQFGVGFYSAFMVSKKVEVISRKKGASESFIWTSEGADGFTISPFDGEIKIFEGTKFEKALGHGTSIILYLKDDEEEENYSKYAQPYEIKHLVKLYSDYIPYPINVMESRMEKYEDADDANVEATNGDNAKGKNAGENPKEFQVNEVVTINSLEPIWKRQKSKVKAQDYNGFYKSHFGEYLDPARVIRTQAEGQVSYTALMFVPSQPSYDYYTKDFQKGLALYSNGVMVMEHCKDVIPDYFNFVKGILDSPDLNINISREMLQKDRQLVAISKNLEKKIKNDLRKFQEEDFDKYVDFFKGFGRQIKLGIYESYGMKKEDLADLLVYENSNGGYTSLKKYKEGMAEGQKEIYYCSGESVDKIKLLPQLELFTSKGINVIFLTEDIDEFVIQVMGSYDDIPIKSISADDIDLKSEEDEKAVKEAEEKYSHVLIKVKEVLGDKVSDVKFSPRLKNSAVCLTTKGALSLEMEKLLKQMPGSDELKAERVLEFNPKHKILEKLKENEEDNDFMEAASRLLYNQALLISGLSVDNPLEMSEDICNLIMK